MIPEYIVTITQNDGTTSTTGNTTVTVDTGGAQGPPGPPGQDGQVGPQGPPGSGSSFFLEQTFASPSTEWVITHNQNTYGVSVETFLPNGDPYEGTVTYPDLNSVKINWYYSTSGYARVFN